MKNKITGASQADVALNVVPADGYFTSAIAKGIHKACEFREKTLQARTLRRDLQQDDEHVIKVGWKKDSIEKSTSLLPISSWMGDNLFGVVEGHRCFRER